MCRKQYDDGSSHPAYWSALQLQSSTRLQWHFQSCGIITMNKHEGIAAVF